MNIDCVKRNLECGARIPSSTYRLQMHEEFDFEDAQEVIAYLHRLGIGDIYCSPIFEARPHSTHGYDVARHDCLSSELGGEEKFKTFAAALRAANMGLLLDIVPNHMGVGKKSVWWQDVLKNGRSSEYADYFDIDWEPLKPELRNKLLLPILKTQYGEALEAKQIQVVLEDGRFVIALSDHRIPIDPRTLSHLIPKNRDSELGVPQDLRRTLDELSRIPRHQNTKTTAVIRRRQRLKKLEPRLAEAMCDPVTRAAVDRAMLIINGEEGNPRSFDALHELLEAQAYRLAFWRTSSEQINYRRFFDVNDLVGLRMESPEVFAKTHSLIRRLLADGDVTGLRIDHCDGMFNPRVYLERLQKLFLAARCGGESPGLGETAPAGIEQPVWSATNDVDWSSARLPLYCVVEKILEPGEALPRTWAVQGTSGYDFVHFSNQLFIQPRNKARFNRIYAEFIGDLTDPAQIIYESKRNVLLSSLSSELSVLTNLLSQLASRDRRVRDFTESLLETAIRETIACFPIYRTYIDERGRISSADMKTIREAIRASKRRNASIDGSVFDYLQRILLLESVGSEEEHVDDANLYFTLKFQQLTGPVMAKGVEDTAFYVYYRFISANEVGSTVDTFGLTANSLHNANVERLHQTPHTLLATSTHDTKRSEDVRNRLNVLSEIPDEWETQVKHWAERNARFKTTLEDGTVAPSANEEYMIYQSIVGAWPWLADDKACFSERMKNYVGKALSEAKVAVSWFNPWSAYTEAVQNFVQKLLVPEGDQVVTQFVSELEIFLKTVSFHGAINSIAQMVLKSTSPGIPDFYQGSELWDLSLVDPDNRRPVDYAKRSRILDDLMSQPAAQALQDVLYTMEDGRLKLLLMHRALSIRKIHQSTFDAGDYVPLTVSHSENIFAYLRGKDILVIIPRFTCSLTRSAPRLPVAGDWTGLRIKLPEEEAAIWHNEITGEDVNAWSGVIDLSVALSKFPVAILLRK